MNKEEEQRFRILEQKIYNENPRYQDYVEHFKLENKFEDEDFISFKLN